MTDRRRCAGVPAVHHEALYQALVRDIEARYRGMRVLSKSASPFCRFIDKVLKVITFGGQDRFMTAYITTFGRRIYVPDGWERIPAGERYCILRHEAVHVAQFRRWTWPGMILLYLLLPLPVGFAGGRAWLEWQGYRETFISTWQIYGRDAARSRRLARDIVRRYTGPDYAWMWLRGRTIQRAIDRLLDRLDADPPPALDIPIPQ